jgi:hypothetical protein
VRWTTIVIESDVSGAVLATLRSSWLKKGPLELTTGVSVTPPVPPPPPVVTVSAMVVECVVEPAVPVTVTVAEAAGAVLAAVRVSVLVPLVSGLGVKLAATPAGRPLALSVTALAKPPLGVIVIVLVPLEPAATDRLAGDAAMAKSAAVAVVTLRLIGTECDRVPLVPVTVSVDVPVAAVLDADRLSVVPVALEVGLTVAVTPAGAPLTLNATLP